VNRLRNRLILVFVAAMLAPLAVTMWVTTTLLEWSRAQTPTLELERTADLLERTGREFYQRECEALRRGADTGAVQPVKYRAAAKSTWPESVQAFAGRETDGQFELGGNRGDRLDYFVRRGGDVWVYTAQLGDVAMQGLTDGIRQARERIDYEKAHDFRSGLKMAYIVLAALVWLVSLALLIYLAHLISRPIHRLTAGLGKLAAGDLTARVEAGRDDEIGRAIQAFNHMADQLRESTERLVYLRQVEGWQMLARKMAHEVKNSLTPIRLTVEEMLARYDEADRAFVEQASVIVVDEIETLERRIRAFSQFAAEPACMAAPVDVNSLLLERIAFLKTAHPEVAYDCRIPAEMPRALADPDLLKGILTNLLENAAEAAGEGGSILGVTAADDRHVAIEVHDSGPGLSEQARASLFQPTISFKKRGMGLGLSIARKSALLFGGDIVLVKGELGGAGFRLLLPVAANGIEARPDRG
jgi:two-component system, NtrC family, nitrogen regulation sensor histidine kinase NtrY